MEIVCFRSLDEKVIKEIEDWSTLTWDRLFPQPEDEIWIYLLYDLGSEERNCIGYAMFKKDAKDYIFLELEYFEIKPGHQRQGWGSKFLKYLIERHEPFYVQTVNRTGPFYFIHGGICLETETSMLGHQTDFLFPASDADLKKLPDHIDVSLVVEWNQRWLREPCKICKKLIYVGRKSQDTDDTDEDEPDPVPEGACLGKCQTAPEFGGFTGLERPIVISEVVESPKVDLKSALDFESLYPSIHQNFTINNIPIPKPNK